jgi:hypothetical protein
MSGLAQALQRQPRSVGTVLGTSKKTPGARPLPQRVHLIGLRAAGKETGSLRLFRYEVPGGNLPTVIRNLTLDHLVL